MEPTTLHPISASTPSHEKQPRDFTLFPELPPELRQRVWCFASHAPRMFEVYACPNEWIGKLSRDQAKERGEFRYHDLRDFQSRCPAKSSSSGLLLSCHESRNIILKVQTKSIFGLPRRPNFDRQKDILFMTSTNALLSFVSSETQRLLNCDGNLVILPINISSGLNKYLSLSTISYFGSRCQGIKRVVVVVPNTEAISYWANELLKTIEPKSKQKKSIYGNLESIFRDELAVSTLEEAVKLLGRIKAYRFGPELEFVLEEDFLGYERKPWTSFFRPPNKEKDDRTFESTSGFESTTVASHQQYRQQVDLGSDWSSGTSIWCGFSDW